VDFILCLFWAAATTGAGGSVRLVVEMGEYKCGCMLRRIVLRAAGFLAVVGCKGCCTAGRFAVFTGACGARKAVRIGDIAWEWYIL
jgi:hypothetical protein